jgi:hypothetical protein
MTDEIMSLRTLLEKSADADLLREMVGFAAQRLMELEVENLTGAAHGERSPDRLNYRNGYRDRDWETRAGTVELRIPKLRKGATSRPFSSHAGWPRVSPNFPWRGFRVRIVHSSEESRTNCRRRVGGQGAVGHHAVSRAARSCSTGR